VGARQIRIGQIVSDAAITYTQFHPVNEGLQAFVNQFNQAGGFCGRKLVIDYDNDNATPGQHDYSSMIHTDFAFVGSFTLMDAIDYQGDAPFEPLYQDKGEYVPDVGSLALSTGRNQSPWFAGPVGAVSPSLVNPGPLNYVVDDAITSHRPCGVAGFLYLRDPTMASQAGARLSESVVGKRLPYKEYVTNIGDPEPVMETVVSQMVSDGVHCVFSYDGLQDAENFATAAQKKGVWPPGSCSGPTCFSELSGTFAMYDPGYIKSSPGAVGTTIALPQIPLNEAATSPALVNYLRALKSVPNATPGTFSILGYASGVMFVDALEACGGAPTRACVMKNLRAMVNWNAGGLVSGVTPFRTTRVDCSGGCNNFAGRGIYNWKWLANCWTIVQVQTRNKVTDWYRVSPRTGYACEDLIIGLGKPA